MFNPISKTFNFGNQEVHLETGHVARQADGAVMVTMGKTQVLCTVVGARSMKEGQDFFPLSVHYQEKTYASGRIPGGYGKREGRPSENETLISRLIDRPIRPLFPKGFMNEVQVICTVVSAERGYEADIAAMIGTSAALSISGIPFNGPIGAAKVGFDHESGYILNPNLEALETSKLEMVVAGTKDAVLMVESEAQELNEDIMLGAVLFAHQEFQVVIKAVEEFAAEVATPAWEWTAPEKDQALIDAVTSQFSDKIGAAYRIVDKSERSNTLKELKDEAVEAIAGDEEGQPSAGDVLGIFSSLEKSIVRGRVVAGEPRIDGRDNKTVRAISVETSPLKSAHGSALFTRGETQAIVAATLGSAKDVLYVDGLNGTQKDYFMLHYNFPSYSVGECGRMGSVGRREIGHGRLAKRGVLATMPTFEEFPYTIRVVSEITESNGSSSMASVCGTSLALMDAGVPVKAPVAGIAMGLVKEDEGFAVLTDILGDEDHLGDMDFKVAGSRNGITALQMDIKIEGITEEIMEIALEQAHTAVHHILDEMGKVISEPRSELSENAPSTKKIKIDADKIRDLIGKGGATIRSICEDTTAQIDISDDGEVTIFGDNAEVLSAAVARVQAVTAEAEVGKAYTGTVKRIVDFGAFVEILPGKDGLVHISQISQERVENVTDVLSEGQQVTVKVLDVDNRGRVKLTMKDVAEAAVE